MATLGDQNERIAEKLRRDHSDVYLFNERLDEDLVFDLDALHRKGFRQKLALDWEIAQLRKACRTHGFKSKRTSVARRRSHARGIKVSGTTTSTPTFTTYNRGEAKSQGRSNEVPDKNKGRDVKKAKATSLDDGLHVDLEKKKLSSEKTLLPYTNVSFAKPLTDPTSSKAKLAGNKTNRTAFYTASAINSSPNELVSCQPPRRHVRDAVPVATTDNNEEDTIEDSGSGSSFSESGSDDDFDTDASSNSGLSVDYLRKKQKSQTKQPVQLVTKEGRLKSSNYGDCLQRGFRAKSRGTLEQNLSILSLDQAPEQWYTSVVHARDIRIGRRPGTSAGRKGFLPQKQPRSKTSIGRVNHEDQPSNTLAKTAASNQKVSSFNSKETEKDKVLFVNHTETDAQRKHRTRQKLHETRGDKQDDSSRSTKLKDEATRPEDPQMEAARPSRMLQANNKVMSRPSTSCKSRRELEAEAEEELGDLDLEDPAVVAIRQRYEESLVHQQNLDIMVKQFVQSLNEIRRSKTKKGLLDRILADSTIRV